MYFYIKNGSLYYDDYKVLNGELSWILVPIGVLILYFKKDWIVYFSNILICIAIIGTIDIYLKYLKHNNKKLYKEFILAGIGHLLLLYPLINIKKYLKPNRKNYLLGLLAILIIIFLPYWPYELSKIIMIIMILIIYIIARILYELKS